VADHLKIIQKISEKHSWKARYQATTDKSHIWQCTNTSESSFVKCQIFITNDCTDKNWSHLNSNEGLKEKFGRHTRKTFSRFTTKDSCTWNITLRRTAPQFKTWILSSGIQHWMKRSTRKKRPVRRDDDDDNDNNNNSTKTSAVLLMLCISGSPLPLYGAFSACGYRKWTPATGTAVNASRKPPTWGGPPVWGLRRAN
jgi:hypothetical protein